MPDIHEDEPEAHELDRLVRGRLARTARGPWPSRLPVRYRGAASTAAPRDRSALRAEPPPSPNRACAASWGEIHVRGEHEDHDEGNADPPHFCHSNLGFRVMLTVSIGMPKAR